MTKKKPFKNNVRDRKDEGKLESIASKGSKSFDVAELVLRGERDVEVINAKTNAESSTIRSIFYRMRRVGLVGRSATLLHAHANKKKQDNPLTGMKLQPVNQSRPIEADQALVSRISFAGHTISHEIVIRFGDDLIPLVNKVFSDPGSLLLFDLVRQKHGYRGDYSRFLVECVDVMGVKHGLIQSE